MSMSRIQLCPQGLEVSRLVYGVWRFMNHPLQGDQKKIRNLVDICLERGVTSFDHADIYGSYQCEALFGQSIGSSQRQRMELISKCGIKLVSSARPEHRSKSYDTSPHHIRLSVEQSLQNLRTDYLDLLLIHRPDPLMDANAVAEVFDELKQAGKVRAFGVSNFTPAQFDLLQSRLDQPLVTNQIEVNPLQSAPFFDGTLDHAQRLRYRPMVWSPLAGGRIWTDRRPEIQPLKKLLEQLSAEKNSSAETLLIAWLLKHPAGLVPVIGSTDSERLQKMLDAETISLSSEEWFAIVQAGIGHEVP